MAALDAQPVLTARVTLPRSGRWHADVRVTAGTEIGGDVSLDLDGVTFNGFAMRAGTFGGETQIRLVGGAGRMGDGLPDRAYQGTPSVRTIVGDILRETGEALALASDGAILDQTVPHYYRRAATGGAALSTLLDLYGARWRTLADGTVLVVGVEAWPEVAPPHALIDADLGAGWVTIAPHGPPDLAPGVTFRGLRIGQVIHELTASGLRTTATVAEPRDIADRSTAARIDYSRRYTGIVERQNADGSIDVALAGLTGLTSVPLRSGFPAARASVAQGARVLVGWEGADPRAPYAEGWADGGTSEWGTILATVSGPASAVPGLLLSLDFFEPTTAGDVALAAALAVIDGSAGALAAVPPTTGLPLVTSTVRAG